MHDVIHMDSEYKSLIKALKKKVVSARMRTMLAANIEQIQLYWDIGQTLITRQKLTRWGSKFLYQVSNDLQHEFQGAKGFSVRNLKYMRQFAQTYPTLEFGQQSVAQLPWGHIITLIHKVKDGIAREWYAQQTLQQGWARDALTRYIKMDLFSRQGQHTHKLTNFKDQLPAPQSDLAQELIQDPLDLGFLPITREAKEREIEKGLVDNVREFLLCMGTGFAFVGSQYHVDVGGDDFYIDLLLFNIKLNAYVVVELKKGKFKPEYAGKLNFYLSVVDDLIKEEHHSPALGLLLCESRNRIVAEYSLSRTESPMGIARYELSKQLPEALKTVLPSTALLEDQLSGELKGSEDQEHVNKEEEMAEIETE